MLVERNEGVDDEPRSVPGEGTRRVPDDCRRDSPRRYGYGRSSHNRIDALQIASRYHRLRSSALGQRWLSRKARCCHQYELNFFPVAWWLILAAYTVLNLSVLFGSVLLFGLGMISIENETLKFMLNDSRVGLGLALFVVSFPMHRHLRGLSGRIRELNRMHRHEPDLVPPWYYLTDRRSTYANRPPDTMFLFTFVALMAILLLAWLGIAWAFGFDQ